MADKQKTRKSVKTIDTSVVQGSTTATDEEQQRTPTAESPFCETKDACELKTVEFTVPKGGKIGIRLSSTCQISSIKDGSAAQTVLRPGDTIKAINGIAVTRRRDLEREILKIKDRVYKFEVFRTKAPYTLPDVEVISTLPKGYDAIPGYKYMIVYMRVYPGADLGIHIMSMDCKVYVTNAPPNTLSGEVFHRGDSILAVDEQPCTNIKTCSTFLTNGLCKKRFVKVLIERPFTEISKKRAKSVLNYQKTIDVDPRMAKDIAEISDAAVALVSKDSALKSIYKEKGASTSKIQRLCIADNSEEIGIQCDPYNPDLLQPVERKTVGRAVSPSRAVSPKSRSKASARKKKSTALLRALFLQRTQEDPPP